MRSERISDFTGTDRFTIHRRIGAGGMGVVYEALDQERRERVALKTLPQMEARALYLLKQEFRSLSDVTHTNLAALHELFSDGEQWFFTMELVDGVNFLDYTGSGSHLSGPGVASPEAPTAPFSESEVSAGRAAEPAPKERVPPRLSSRSGSSSPASYPLLRAALRQLGEGLGALHAAGKLHRDIKPSNVLVARDGRVVLLDFGLVTELEPPPLDSRTDPEFVGTIAYMAPEQAAGEPLSPASDWYSVGVMLYEALTGRRPFMGTKVQVLEDKQAREPCPPRELVPDIPEDLHALCMDLLRRRPEDRPSGREVLRRLGAAPTGLPTGSGPRPRAPFVGRDRHRAALADAYLAITHGQTVTVSIHGPSGVGKSFLVQRFLETLLEDGEPVVILTGRCYERESVPYKALDSLVDALSRYLDRLPRAQVSKLIPREVPALARLFPVLRQVEAVAEACLAAPTIPDPQELRRRAFGALRDLLGRLGDRRPLVLYIDDLQWGDVDSVALLSELLRPPEPPVLLLLLSYRSKYAETSPCLQALREVRKRLLAPLDWRELAVEPLSPGEARELGLEFLGREGAATEALAGVIARESEGNPYFIRELVQYLQGGVETRNRLSSAEKITLEDVLWTRVTGLPDGSRRLLEIVTVSGKPLRQTDAYRAAALGTEDRAALTLLRVGHLVMSTGPGEQDEVEAYHDRIRETILARLSPLTLTHHHRNLAVTLEASGHADPESLGLHFQRAGEPAKAGRYYQVAAEEAAEALAFQRAAELYRLALELQPVRAAEERLLRTRLADALANAGRGAEAAREYLQAAEGAEAREALELQRRAAFQYCISGHLDEGRAVFRTVLAAVGMRLPGTPRRAILSLLGNRLLLWLRGLKFRERSANQIPPEELTRIDITRSVAVGISVVDPVCGAGFQTRSLLLALRAGEPFRVGLALAWEAAHAALAGGPGWQRTKKLLEQTRAVAERIKDPHVQGMATLATGIGEFFMGRFQTARDLSEQAEGLFRERCTGVPWELDTAHAFALWSLLYLGELGRMRDRFLALFKEAQARGDRYDQANLGTQIGALARLATDEVEEARHLLREVMERWTHEGFNIQHLSAIYGWLYLDLYTGQGPTAWDRIAPLWRQCQQSFLLRIQQVRIDMQQLSGRSALAAAETARAPQPLLRQAESYARQLEKERMPWADALCRLIRAGVAARRGDRSAAAGLLRDAASRFDAVPMGLFAAVSRRRLGETLRGDEGRTLVDGANAWMQARGIRNPTRMTAALGPGFSD